MIYSLFFSPINFSFSYVCLAFVLSFGITFISLKYLIKYFHTKQEYQPIRTADASKNELAPDHQQKQKTPTMGGIAIFLGSVIPMLLFCDLSLIYIRLTLFVIVSFALIGFIDDYRKVIKHDTKGFRGSKKLITQLLFATVAVMTLIYKNTDYLTSPVFIPFFNYRLYLGNLIPTFYLLSIVGSSNSANLTDGIDGLLSGVVMVSVIALMLLTLLISKVYLLDVIYLDINLINNMIMVLTVLLSSFLGFFVFNRHPAKIFMGDTSSLFVGAVLCFIAILLKVEFFYALIFLIPILETLSVTIQVIYFKATNGKRLFKMTPFHHSLEKSGWGEWKICFVLWSWTALFSAVAILSYYLYCK